MTVTSDYMSSEVEMKKQPDALGVCQMIANAWPHAEERTSIFNAIWSFWNFVHVWDDLIDEADWPLAKKELAWKALYSFVDDLLLNPFYRRFAPQIRALFVSGVARSLDGDAMERSDDPAKKALAPAVRCADVDILVGFAELCGGWDLMREIGKRREYDPSDKEGTVSHV